MAGLRGFASHGGSILSRGWLATVEAPGYPRHLLPLKRGSWLTVCYTVLYQFPSFSELDTMYMYANFIVPGKSAETGYEVMTACL